MRLIECDVCGEQHNVDHDWSTLVISLEVEVNRMMNITETREKHWDLCYRCGVRSTTFSGVIKAIKEAVRGVTNPPPEPTPKSK